MLDKTLMLLLLFPPPMPPHVLVDFVILPPGHGRSVTDFWGWDAHKAQLRCPDDVSGDNTNVINFKDVIYTKQAQEKQTAGFHLDGNELFSIAGNFWNA